MGRRKKRPEGESMAGYFKEIFQERPDLLHGTSNQELVARWVKDHAGHTPEDLKKAKANLANIKSVLRKKERDVQESRGKPHRRQTLAAPTNSYSGNLEDLEVAIDDCLTRARVLDATGLAMVIQHLRAARNGVVWQSGQGR